MLSNNLNSMFEYWKSFDLGQLQRDLDRDATEIANRQDESEVSRKKLVEMSKEFKRTTPDDVRKMVAPLLKFFQAEIDALSKRSKNGETAFLNIYKKIIEIPDPTPSLEYSLQLQKKASKVQELEVINKQLKDRLDEYNSEFAEVKNQEITVKQLKEKLKEYEDKMETQANAIANEKERDIQRVYAEKEKQWIDKQMDLAKKLGEAEHRVNMLQSALNSVQSDLFDVKTKHDEAMAAKSDEVDLLIGDLERANERALSAERQLEQMRNHDNEQNLATVAMGNRDEHRHENADHAIDILKRTSLEVELAAKEKEVSQLVEDVQRLQQLVNKLRDTSSSQLARLEEELTNKSEALERLQAILKTQEDFEEIKRELSVLKSLEFSCLNTNFVEKGDSQQSTTMLNSETKSLETLLLEKNRMLQNENTTLKCACNDVKERYQKLEEQYGDTMSTVQEQKRLIIQLEEDLRSVNALSVMFRGDAEGEAVSTTNQTADIMASLVKESRSQATTITTSGQDPPPPKSPSDGLLLIIQNQRERFRLRAQELETVSLAQQQQMQMQQNEMDKLRSDNLKLYEKIKFLQGYSTHNKSSSHHHAHQSPSSSSSSSGAVGTNQMLDDTESRYSSQYDQRLDPFHSFNQRERMKRYMDLKPYDKITLGMGRFIMGSKIARTIVFFYTLFLHIFVFMVLYKLAYTASCQRDTAAEDWHQKFADHMASHHPHGGVD